MVLGKRKEQQAKKKRKKENTKRGMEKTSWLNKWVETHFGSHYLLR